jgi:uncharacterized OB-fold protein
MPVPEGLAKIYWDAAQEERLLLQRCARCGHVWHPPSEFCSRCQDGTFTWIEASGTGVVHSFTVIHHAAHPAVAVWLPYTVLLVDLDEGPRLVGRLLAPSTGIGIGAPVRLAFDRYTDLKVPGFVLARDWDAAH